MGLVHAGSAFFIYKEDQLAQFRNTVDNHPHNCTAKPQALQAPSKLGTRAGTSSCALPALHCPPRCTASTTLLWLDRTHCCLPGLVCVPKPPAANKAYSAVLRMWSPQAKVLTIPCYQLGLCARCLPHQDWEIRVCLFHLCIVSHDEIPVEPGRSNECRLQPQRPICSKHSLLHWRGCQTHLVESILKSAQRNQG